jgi:mannose-6-phosphate isomerase-like protein (cupin superfamily)
VIEPALTFTLPDGTSVSLPDPAVETPVLEMTVPPGAYASPPHVHLNETDEFEILEGVLDVLQGDHWRTLARGDVLRIQPGVVHTYRNPHKATARVRNVHQPARGPFDDYVRDLAWLARTNRLTSYRSPRSLLWLAVLWREHRTTMRLARRRERWPLLALGAVGGLAGIRLAS